MPFPVFKDLFKNASDLLSDDFDSKYTLKIKSVGPENTSLTTTIAIDKGLLKPKLAGKWAGPSGFTVDKLEFTADCKPTVETSLTGLVDGLKVEFKGNDTDKGEMSLTHKIPMATFTSTIDVLKFEKATLAVVSGHGDFTGGVCVDAKLAKMSPQSFVINVGAGYSMPKVVDLGVTANISKGSYTGLCEYKGISDSVKLAGSVTYSSSVSAAVVASYKCNPDTTMKAKVTTDGVASFSVKQTLPKKLVVVGSAELPVSAGLSGLKFGINATLG